MAPAAARARPAHRGGRGDDLGRRRRHEHAAPEPQLRHVRHRCRAGHAARQRPAAWPPTSPPSSAAGVRRIVIENKDIATGTTQSVYLRAENPHGLYDKPMLGLVSGGYPSGPGQVALTSQVAALYGAHVGGTWQAAGTTWRVTGIVQDPSNLRDEFALVAPGQVAIPIKCDRCSVPAPSSRPSGTAVRRRPCPAFRRRRPSRPPTMSAGSRRRRSSWLWRWSAWSSSACWR